MRMVSIIRMMKIFKIMTTLIMMTIMAMKMIMWVMMMIIMWVMMMMMITVDEIGMQEPTVLRLPRILVETISQRAKGKIFRRIILDCLIN